MRHKLRHATQKKDPENNGEHHSPKRVPLRWLPWLRLKQNDREEVSLEPKCLKRGGWEEGKEEGRSGRWGMRGDGGERVSGGGGPDWGDFTRVSIHSRARLCT